LAGGIHIQGQLQSCFYGRLVIARERSQFTFLRKELENLAGGAGGRGGILSDRDTRKVMQFLLENGLFGRVVHTYSTVPRFVKLKSLSSGKVVLLARATGSVLGKSDPSQFFKRRQYCIIGKLRHLSLYLGRGWNQWQGLSQYFSHSK
jgi:hypothetical protein